jgi:hypothetical protein
VITTGYELEGEEDNDGWWVKLEALTIIHNSILPLSINLYLLNLWTIALFVRTYLWCLVCKNYLCLCLSLICGAILFYVICWIEHV